MMWGEHLSRRHWEYQKTPNDSNYCYLNPNPHCVKENNSYVHNLPVYNDRLVVNIHDVDSRKHDHMKNEYKTDHKILNQNSGINSSMDVSTTVSTPPCNNLYVNPPYFTVDKFVNMDQPNHRDNRQMIQPNRNNSNQKEISNSLDYKIPESRENILLSNNNLVGIKVIDNSHIPLMHFETPDRPDMINVHKQYVQQPVIAPEMCNYKNDLVPYENESFHSRKKSYPNMNYVQETNPKNDYIRNQFVPIHQYSDGGESLIKIEDKNPYRMPDTNTTIRNNHHRIPPNDLQCIEIQKSTPPNGYGKPCVTPAKNISREKRKPNYRELINNALALRNSMSENDLNMQIIKRTLNYKQLPTCNFPPRNIEVQSFTRNNDNLCQKVEKADIYEKPHINHLYVQPPDDSVTCKRPTNIASPLDLSLKTIKTENDLYKRKVNNGVIIEKGCPPKFNFEPNFVEKVYYMSNNDSNASRLQPNQNSVIRFNSNSSRQSMECKVEENVYLQGLKPEVHSSTTSNSVNTINDRDWEISRKRTYPNEHFYENKYLVKKKYFNSSFCASYNDNPLNFKQERPNQTSVIKTIQINTTDENEISSTFDQANIKPEPKPEPEPEPGSEPRPEPEQELKPELKPEFKLDLKPELNSELKSEVSSVEDPESTTESENLIKQDISSSFASRIRTKAELKGFVFQDEGADVQSKNLDLKTNLDLCDWNFTCDKFVDQLDQCFEKTFKATSPKTQQCSKPSVQIDSKNESSSNSNSPKRSNTRDSNEAPKFPTKRWLFDFDLYSDDEELNESTQTKTIDGAAKSVNTQLLQKTTETDNAAGLNDNVSDTLNISSIKNITDSDNATLTEDYDKSVNGTDSKSYGDNLVDKLSETNSHLEEARSTKQDPENNVVNNVHRTSSVDSEIALLDSTTTIVTDNSKKTKTSSHFDLTKVSVVRLKREKYNSRIPKQKEEEKAKDCDAEKGQSPEKSTKDDDTGKSESQNITSPNSVNGTQPAMRNSNQSYSFARSRRRKNEDNSKIKSPNINTIKTRLRTQAMENKKNSVFKNNKSKRRSDNKSESDLPSNTEKIYLEVYRYKRALKVPPNLITIKSKCVQKITKSLDDPFADSNISTNKNDEATSSSELKKDNVPKSIIDVLHSRVVKAKQQVQHNKFTQKYMKNDRQQASKSKLPQLSFSISKNDQFQPIWNENNNVCSQEKRNVFETQVIPSRTRREHKMHLSKETIREVFRGDERPSSAPPHINILEDIYDKTYNDQCMKYFQKLSQRAAESDLQNSNLNQKSENENANSLECSSSSSKIKETEQGKDDNECNNNNNNLNKNKRKRKRRIYKRRISSGFDYLRKKKRANTCALRNYSRFKRRKSLTEENFSFRSESDILKEIQKWVLNKGVGQSALHKAATLGYIDVIVYCLERMGLHPDHKDNAGYTPLHDACVNGCLDIARVLLQYGANHSESAHSGIRPIHEASENGHIEIVRMLLSYGADPLLETYAGQTPLMLASDPKVSNLISMHLNDVEMDDKNRKPWLFPGPWSLYDENENGCNVFKDIFPIDSVERDLVKKHNPRRDFRYFQNNEWKANGNELLSICDQNPSIKTIFRDFEFLYDTTNSDGELFEFEEADSPLPPLYLLKDEGMEKWVLLSDLCSLLKVKSKDTLLHKIFPSVSPSHVSRAFLRELKMCEFLERATCLQLLCAGEKINICHSKVVLIRYNENVRNLLGVKTIIMKL